MSFVMNNARIKELIEEAGSPLYSVETFNIVPIELKVPKASTVISSTSYAPHMITVADPAEYIATLRRNVVESGTELKTIDELNREIDEIRGR